MSGRLGTQRPTVAACASGAITLSGAQTVDGVALTAGMLCLVAGNGAGNDVYLVQSGAWVRLLPPGALTVTVTGGANAGTWAGASGGEFAKQGGTPARLVPTDAVLCWYDWNGPGNTWPNSGSGGTLPLSEVGGTSYAAPGQYGDVGYLPAALGSASDGAMLATAATTAGQGQTIVACCWFCLPTLSTGPVLRLLFGSQSGSSAWVDPYDHWGLFVASSGALIGAVSTTVGGSNDTLIVSDTGLVEAGKWYHAALVINGGEATLYLQGVALGSAPLDGDVITGTGRYIVGGLPTDGGGTLPRYCAGIVADPQVFTSATPAGKSAAAYLADVAATRREP